MTNSRPSAWSKVGIGRIGSLPRLAAATWCTLFGFVHIYWALGGGVGLPSDLRLSDHPYLFVADVVAIPLCFLFAWLAAGLTEAGQPLRRLLLGCAGAFCLVHALPPLSSYAWRTLTSAESILLTQRQQLAVFVYEPYWLLGGILFLSALFVRPRKSKGIPVHPTPA